MMKRFSTSALVTIAVSLITLMPIATFAADTGTQLGPVWKTWFARVDAQKMDDYLHFLATVYRYELDAMKEAGVITDYKIMVQKPSNPDDWNVAIIYQYKNFAALDVPDDVVHRVEDAAVEKLGEEAKKMRDDKWGWRRPIATRYSRELLWK